MLSNSRAAYSNHDHSRCESAAIERAKAVCDQQTVKLTPIREAVLKIIWQHHKPMGAYDIVDRLPEVFGKRVLAPTVYRAIDFLLSLGLIHRIASLNAYIGCPFPGSRHSDIFLICRNCNIAAECSAESVNSAIAITAEKSGFIMDSQSIEVLGLCPKCQDLTT